MLASIDTFAAIALVLVAMVFLMGFGAFVGTMAGRRAAQDLAREYHASQSRLAGNPNRDLEQCLELSGSAARDADSALAILDERSSSLPPDLLGVMKQLIKTTKDLSGQLQRGEDTQSTGNEGSSRPPAPLATKTPPDDPKRAIKASGQATSALDESKFLLMRRAELDEARRFSRSPCHGQLKATIYPPPSAPGGEAVHCIVLTRDLSCGGIGIAHTEQLFPRQIVVLDAVGKLLVGEVRWCRQVDVRFFIVGCRLVKTSD